MSPWRHEDAHKTQPRTEQLNQTTKSLGDYVHGDWKERTILLFLQLERWSLMFPLRSRGRTGSVQVNQHLTFLFLQYSCISYSTHKINQQLLWWSNFVFFNLRQNCTHYWFSAAQIPKPNFAVVLSYSWVLLFTTHLLTCWHTDEQVRQRGVVRMDVAQRLWPNHHTGEGYMLWTGASVFASLRQTWAHSWREAWLSRDINIRYYCFLTPDQFDNPPVGSCGCFLVPFQ